MPWSTMSTWVLDASLRTSSCRPEEKRCSLRGMKYMVMVVAVCKALSSHFDAQTTRLDRKKWTGKYYYYYYFSSSLIG